MRSGDEFSELADLGSSYVGGRPFGSGYGSSTYTNKNYRGGRLPAEAEDALGPNGSPRGHSRSRSGLYYSPPGTSYTIVERPSSAMHHHSREYKEYNAYHTSNYNASNPRGTYLGSNPSFSQRGSSNNKKRPISPEQVLRLFGSNNQSNTKLNVADRNRRSPASSPPSTTHQTNYGRSQWGPSLHELCTRTITMVRDPADGTHGFGICVKGGKDSGKEALLPLMKL